MRRLSLFQRRTNAARTRAAAAGIEVRPCFAVQQLGRFDDYLRDVNKDLRAGLDESDIAQAGLAITKRSYQLAKERGYRAVIMPAGLREVYHLTELAGRGNGVFPPSAYSADGIGCGSAPVSNASKSR